jgi:four helix bundle protein
MLSFQKLDVYRCSIDFIVVSRRIRQSLGRGNADLSDQLRRSAQSAPQNIAEGVGKVSKPDKARYFAMARGSAMESAAHVDVMRAEQLISEETYAEAVALLERIVAMLTRLIDP